MGIEELITWYQKKIGTYDKQPWEKTVEQSILHGLNHIQLKTAKPKTDLIDLDLVRGSSFTKTKPKHGFITVVRLSICRFFLLPLYSKWWIQQTSTRIFGVLLMLYFLQLVTLALYSYNITPNAQNGLTSELIVPMGMMWAMSFIISQIVATSPNGPDNLKRKITKYRKSYNRRKRRVRKMDKANELDRSWKGKGPNSPRSSSVIFEEGSPEQKRCDDDGFESLNGNGSSPSNNGEVQEEKSTSTSGLRVNEWVKSVQGITLKRRQSAPDLRSKRYFHESDSDSFPHNSLQRLTIPTVIKLSAESNGETDEEGECETLSSPETVGSGAIDAHTSANEWIVITTNSEDCSYSSEMSESDHQLDSYDIDAPPTYILNHNCGPSDRVSCTIWDKRETKKADLSVIEISSVIIARVESMPESKYYFYIGIFFSILLASLPILSRLFNSMNLTSDEDELQLTLIQLINKVHVKFGESFGDILDSCLGTVLWERVLLMIAVIQRGILGFLLFFLLAVAERTFKQRFLYAKLFTHLTSFRRARKSELPHFRLHKVRNIKTWLSVRSYLKKRGPQRSVDVIVSASFIVMLLLLSFLCVELLQESFTLNSHYNMEIMIWVLGLGIFIMRYMTLGVKINKKYRNLSVLITEQINLYLQIEKKPHKKEELMVANSVLKLAADLLKELESQFKILGLSANPLLYNITKFVILSALSGVLSEILGFKLKLHKIKIK